MSLRFISEDAKKKYYLEYHNSSKPTDPNFLKWLSDNNWQQTKSIIDLWVNNVFVLPAMTIFQLYDEYRFENKLSVSINFKSKIKICNNSPK